MFPCNPSYLGKGLKGTACPLSHVKIGLVYELLINGGVSIIKSGFLEMKGKKMKLISYAFRETRGVRLPTKPPR
jgi:hypothetical protein